MTLIPSALSPMFQPFPPTPIDCGTDQFRFAASLRELPGEIRLESGRRVALADFGQPYDGGYNRTGLPGERFAGAAVGRDHIFVVIQGDLTPVVYHDQIWAFERRGKEWVGQARFGGGSTVEEILASTCRQAAHAKHSTIGTLQLDCEFERAALLSVRYSGPGIHGDFEARPTDKMHWVFQPSDITVVGSNRPISITQQSEMLQTLRTAKASMKKDDECLWVIDRFLDAFEGQKGV